MFKVAASAFKVILCTLLFAFLTVATTPSIGPSSQIVTQKESVKNTLVSKHQCKDNSCFVEESLEEASEADDLITLHFESLSYAIGLLIDIPVYPSMNLSMQPVLVDGKKRSLCISSLFVCGPPANA